jgi:Holliday junction DNA helicase RuvB
LEFYEENEIEEIIKRSAKLLNVEIDKEAITEIAKRSRRTPRTANYLLKRARDYAQVKKTDLTTNMVMESLELLGIDGIGFNHSDRQLLITMVEKFNGGPVGLNTLSASLSEEEETIEEYNEPYLMQLGFIERTPRGRQVTELGYAHLGKKKPENKLF